MPIVDGGNAFSTYDDGSVPVVLSNRNKYMWFGTREHSMWILCPQIGYDGSKHGWSGRADYLNGGASVRRSVASHKEYNFSWTMKTRDDLRAITDFADRIYGQGPFYFIDPFAMDRNILPAWLASPMQGGYDGPLLAGDVKPDLTPTGENSFNRPIRSATYRVTAASYLPQFYFPIPEGKTLWIGAHGMSTGDNGVYVKGATGPSSAELPTQLLMQTISDGSPFNRSFDSAAYDGVFISLGGTAGNVTITDIMAQVLPTGQQPPAVLPFISGQGNSGVSFDNEPQITQHSAAIDKVSGTVNLVETAAWA